MPGTRVQPQVQPDPQVADPVAGQAPVGEGRQERPLDHDEQQAG